MTEIYPTDLVQEFRDDFGDLIIFRTVAGSDYTQIHFFIDSAELQASSIEEFSEQSEAFMTFTHEALIKFAELCMQRGLAMKKHYESL